MRSILLLHPVARYMETIDVCIWYMFVFKFCSDCVGSRMQEATIENNVVNMCAVGEFWV